MSVAADKRSKRGEANVRAEATETHTSMCLQAAGTGFPAS